MALSAKLSFNYGLVEQQLVPTNQRLASKQVSKRNFHSINLFGFATDVGDAPLVCSSEATKEKRKT
jgi:hypothetical protein